MSGEAQERVGVYVCHCGGNISDVVDVKQVAERVGRLPGVVVARTHMFMCSDPGQQLIQEDIRDQGLTRVVVASCSPRLHEQTFRRALERAGLNPYLYEHANIREQVSWVTHAHPAEATDKATLLVAAAVAKARELRPLEPIKVESRRRAAVIGGGISGLKCARDLAAMGIGVTLVERSPFLGGHVVELDRVYPTEEEAKSLLEPLIREVTGDPRIEVLTNAEVIEAEGYVGDFRLKVRVRSKGMAEGPDRLEVQAGVVVVATGFEHYEPAVGEFGYGEMPEVVTLPQLIRAMAKARAGRSESQAGMAPIASQGGEDSSGTPLSTSPDGALLWNGRTVRSIAMIHCVGSRQIEGIHQAKEGEQLHEYCSRVCCTATLQAANEIRDLFPGVNIFDFYRDIRTYGRGHEEYYEDAGRKGVLFFRYAPEEPPVVERPPDGAAHALVIRVKDRLTWGEEVEVPVDLVVLSVGMVPRPVGDLVGMFKLPVGSDGFLLEVHPKLRPVEVAVNGVLIAGTAQGPKDITESAAAASAAAAKAATILSRGYVELDPFVAEVDPDRCNGCGECVGVCSYQGALTMMGEGPVAWVNPALCKGCGACAAVCPTEAIELNGWTLRQFDAMVDALCNDDLVAEAAG